MSPPPRAFRPTSEVLQSSPSNFFFNSPPTKTQFRRSSIYYGKPYTKWSNRKKVTYLWRCKADRLIFLLAVLFRNEVRQRTFTFAERHNRLACGPKGMTAGWRRGVAASASIQTDLRAASVLAEQLFSTSPRPKLSFGASAFTMETLYKMAKPEKSDIQVIGYFFGSFRWEELLGRRGGRNKSSAFSTNDNTDGKSTDTV